LAFYLNGKLSQIPGLEIISDAPGPIQSFVLQDIHPHDVAQILANDGICVRAGYHCAQPLLEAIGPVTRVSIGFHNTEEDVDYLAERLSTIRKRMGYE
jgi:cysteine desulfurase/selenocysteine lyase